MSLNPAHLDLARCSWFADGAGLINSTVDASVPIKRGARSLHAILPGYTVDGAVAPAVASVPLLFVQQDVSIHRVCI